MLRINAKSHYIDRLAALGARISGFVVGYLCHPRTRRHRQPHQNSSGRLTHQPPGRPPSFFRHGDSTSCGPDAWAAAAGRRERTADIRPRHFGRLRQNRRWASKDWVDAERFSF